MPGNGTQTRRGRQPAAPDPLVADPMTQLRTEQDQIQQAALEQAMLMRKDCALETVLTVMIQMHQPAWVLEELVKIREDYGFDNSRFIEKPREPAQ